MSIRWGGVPLPFLEPIIMKRLRESPGRRRARCRGVLTLEWILLVTILVIGTMGGLAAVRNAVIGELRDLAQAIEALNVDPSPQTYYLSE